ncbi:MAG: hypothetical protein ACYC3I_12915 [Gemmataceae bacterium]
MEAVRRAMDTLGYDSSPSEIQKHIKENFDQDMTPNMISSYKSTLRGKAGLAGHRKKKRGRPKKDGVVATAAAPTSSHDAVPWKDIRTIKDIAGRIGKKGLRELVELLD